jgi:hypothetical protein
MNPEISSVFGRDRGLPKFEITGFATPLSLQRARLGTTGGSHDTQARPGPQAWQKNPARSILQAIGRAYRHLLAKKGRRRIKRHDGL